MSFHQPDTLCSLQRNYSSFPHHFEPMITARLQGVKEKMKKFL